MKTDATQMEILLVTGTSFSSRQFSELGTAPQNQKSEKENLETACWNGLLEEMLPEINPHDNGSNQIFLWQIKEGNKFIELEMGAVPALPDQLLSIDPYTFFCGLSLS